MADIVTEEDSQPYHSGKFKQQQMFLILQYVQTRKDLNNSIVVGKMIHFVHINPSELLQTWRQMTSLVISQYQAE